MIRPQLAKEATVTSLTHFIESDKYVMEQKLDGHRLLLCSPGGDYPPTALTRAGTPYTRRLPKALQDYRFPENNGPMDFILDGELVDGTFYVFDMIVRGVVDETLPLRARRAILEQDLAWRDGCEAIKVVPQAKTREEKIALSEKALASNFEGLIIKDANSPYRSGMRTEEWMKVKFVSTADCIVLGVRDDGKESARLGMVAPTPEGYGKVAEGLQFVDVGRASLIGKEKNGAINRGDVVEIRYLYCGAGGRLFQPTILRKRIDKPMHECTTDQLKHVNKAVMEVL